MKPSPCFSSGITVLLPERIMKIGDSLWFWLKHNKSTFCWRILLLTEVIFTSVSALNAASPDIQWTKTFGGNQEERSYSVQQTLDGGYILTGFTSSYGAGTYDVWLIKTNSWGDIMWTKTFGDTAWDIGVSAQQTTDGGYVVAGYTYSYGAGFSDVWLIKTNALGDTIWTRTFGGNRWDEGYSVMQTTDGGYIIIGRTNSFGAGNYDAWLIKTDSSGDTIWSKTFGGSADDWCGTGQQTADGGYIMAGLTESYGAGLSDVWLIKTNSLGDTLWTRTAGGSGNDLAYSVQQTVDGGYIIAGWTESYGAGLVDVWLIRTNSLGNTLWTKTFGGTDSDWGYSVRQTYDRGYIIVGPTSSYGNRLEQLWLIKTDSSGNSIWTMTLGGSGNDRGRSVQQTADSCYIMTGWTDSYGAGLFDIWLIKTKEKSEVKSVPKYCSFSLRSNPAKGRVVFDLYTPDDAMITLRIYDVLGRFIDMPASGSKAAGSHRIVWTPRVNSGIYFYSLETVWLRKSGKFILLR